MDKKTLILIKEVRENLKNSGIDLQGIYLFGSRSKGIQETDSDYDVAIVIKSKVTHETKDFVRSIVYDIMLKHDVVIDSHIYSEKDISDPQTPFREVIKNEGIFYAG